MWQQQLPYCRLPAPVVKGRLTQKVEYDGCQKLNMLLIRFVMISYYIIVW